MIQPHFFFWVDKKNLMKNKMKINLFITHLLIPEHEDLLMKFS